MKTDASDSWQDRDVFTGPAVERAMRLAESIAAGSVVRTTFSGYDTGDLIDLEGFSFIAKLPEAVPPNPASTGADPVEYRPRWVDRYVEETRCWLLDVAVLKNWFADNPTQDAIAVSREKSLDPARRWGRTASRLRLPANYPLGVEDGFHLFPACPEQPLRVGEDIPLAVWLLNRPGISYRDVHAVAASAPLACVWVVRFQESFPGDTSAAGVEAPAAPDPAA